MDQKYLFLILGLVLGFGLAMFLAFKYLPQQISTPAQNQFGFLTSTPATSSIGATAGTSTPIVNQTASKANLGWQSSYSSPYAVSWQADNGTQIDLSQATLMPQSDNSYDLTLFLNINSPYGSFCTNSFANTNAVKLVLDEQGNMASPLILDNGCTNSGSLFSQRLLFSFNQSQDQFKQGISIEVFDSAGQEQTYFTLMPLPDGSIQAQPAQNQG